MPLEKTRRVSRLGLCPVCGRRDWCLVARDGRYAVCMRVESQRPARGGLGGWIHHPGDGRPAPAALAAAVGRVPTAAPLERRHAVYRRLQAEVPLRGRHVQAPVGRGCERQEAGARGYATLQLQGRAAIARLCHGGDPGVLAGVPGFFLQEALQGGDFWSLAGRPGMLIPCLDPAGRVRAFTLRPDDPGPKGPKYTWWSSDGRPGGAGSGVHCHVARPLFGPPRDSALWLTEGPLKADLASQRLGAVVLAVPGVSVWPRALPDLAALLPDGGRVVVALDADWRVNPAVHAAVWGLTLTCRAFGYAVEVALWPATHKGLDDLLTAGKTPERTEPGVIPAPPWPLKLSSQILAPAPGPAPPPALQLPGMREALDAAFRSH